MANFRKFPSINQFYNVIKHANAKPLLFPKEVSYRARVKLHGTNACLSVNNGKAFGQKRSNVVTLDSDNFEFAQFVNEINDKIVSAIPEDTWLFGEWVGPGIQGKVALSKIPEKVFVAFAVYTETDDAKYMSTDQDVIDLYVSAIDDPRVLSMPWYTKTYKINFFDKNEIQKFADEMNSIIDTVEKECPFCKDVYNISGIGEGLVFVPVEVDGEVNEDRELFSKLAFKAKGEKHQKQKTNRKPIEIAPEELKTRNEFVRRFVTVDRMESMAERYCDNNFFMENMGKFLKELSLDIKREAADELEVNNIEWKEVCKDVQKEARNWFIIKNRDL